MQAWAARMAAKPFLIRLYLALSALLPPVWALALRIRARRDKEDPARLSEKWGHAACPRPDGELVWLHGVSVGETTVLLTLLERLSAARPQTHFLLTSVTRASAEALANRRLPPRVIHHYAPIDCPGPVNRFLGHWRPDLFVLSEMDLWPRLMNETRRRGVPMLMLNTHVTARRHRRRSRVARANGWLMGLFDEIHVQDDRSHALFLDLGAPADRMQVTGLLKAASTPPPDQPEARHALLGQIGNRPVWLAASTRQVEEALIMQAQAHAMRLCPEILLIIAPRQMREADRTEADACAVFARDQVARRSRNDPITKDTCIYIADSLGEMGAWYRIVPVAYPGQSLPLEGVVMAGKNPFEALALGVMVVHGPQTGNFRAAYDILRARGAALEVASAEALAEAVVKAQDAEFRAPFLAAAETVLARTMAPLEKAFESVTRRLDGRA